MERKFLHLYVAGILVFLAVSMNAQTDTITKPGRPFKDPKATGDNSKVLLDTSSNVVDSLLHQRDPVNRRHNSDKTGKSEPVRLKKKPCGFCASPSTTIGWYIL